MTDRVRWSDASSDADPVLRAVMRYGQQLAPSSQDVASVTAAVVRAEAGLAPETASRGARTRRLVARAKPSRTVVAWGGSLAFLAAAAVSLAMNMDRLDAPRGVAQLRPEIVPSQLVPVVRSAAARAKPPAPPPVSIDPVSALHRAPAESASASLRSGGSAAAEGSTELSLLTTVRHELRARPERCLALLATHQAQYPSSSFSEERAALRVEALFRVGRHEEAEREYRRFTARFPGSIYTPRLTGIRRR